MGWWYWIGVSVGFGASAGILMSGLPFRRTGLDWLAALVIGGVIGLSFSGPHRGHWSDVAGGAVGALAAYLGAVVIVAGAFRRGGTRIGLAVLMFGIAFAAVCLAWIPVVGFLEAAVIPALAYRLRRLQPERYAGLRTLAKD